MSKLSEFSSAFESNNEKINQLDLKMIDICDTMEGMVKIIRDNGAQIKHQLELKIENVTQDCEIFETKINRAYSEIASKIQGLAESNTLLIQQVFKLNDMIEEDDQENDSEDDEQEADSETDQENIVPNKDTTAHFKSKALSELIQSKDIKMKLAKTQKSSNMANIKIVD